MTCSLKLYTPEYINLKAEPLFLGCARNTQKFEDTKYPWLDDINEKMISFYWHPEEIKLTQDKKDFEEAPENIKFIYTRVLQKLIFLDSLQGRAPMLLFGQLTTLPELENTILTQTFFEGAIHSRTYSHNLQNVYPNPTEIFDESFTIDILIRHAKTVLEYYEDAYKHVIDYLYKRMNNIPIDNKYLHELKKIILLALVSVNGLEGTRFYSGFPTIWNFTETYGMFPGTSKELELICRDENQHLALTQWLLNKLRKDESEGFVDAYKEIEPLIIEKYKKISQEEIEWSEYLFQHGSVIGLNKEILGEYVKYITNRRMKAIGLEPLYPDVKKDPLPWTQSWIKESSKEAKPQEIELVDYIVGGVDMSKGDGKEHFDDIFKGVK